MKLWKAAILGSAVGTVDSDCQMDIELFLLHDVSSSWHANDQANVYEQMPEVVDSLNLSFNSVRFGFGSFVDKPVDPFGVSGDYCYQRHIPLTDDLDAYLAEFDQITQGAGGDSKDAQLWSLLAAVTDPNILWSSGTDPSVMRVVAITTANDFHEHPDGQNMNPTHGFLNHTGGFDADCLTHDYPSADQVGLALAAEGTRVIFLTKSSAMDHYYDLMYNLGWDYAVPVVVASMRGDSNNFKMRLLSGISDFGCPYTPPSTDAAPTTPSPNPTDAPGDCVFDIAHVVDNSYSYDSSYDMMKQEMGILATHLQTWHPDSRIGISSFVDKPMAPFGYEDYDYCYDFHHALDLDVGAIVDTYDDIHRKSGFDFRENQLDGAIKTLLDDRMGWRASSSEGNLINVVLITTDAWYHELGHWPEGAPPTAQFESDCMVEDYPSVENFAQVLLQKNAAAIFMVPDQWKWVYDDLVNQLAALGVDSTVVALNPNFRNFNEEAEAGLRTLAQECLVHLP